MLSFRLKVTFHIFNIIRSINTIQTFTYRLNVYETSSTSTIIPPVSYAFIFKKFRTLPKHDKREWLGKRTTSLALYA